MPTVVGLLRSWWAGLRSAGGILNRQNRPNTIFGHFFEFAAERLKAFELLESGVISTLDGRVVAEIAAKGNVGLIIINERLNYGCVRIEVLAGFAVVREHLDFDAAGAKNAP